MHRESVKPMLGVSSKLGQLSKYFEKDLVLTRLSSFVTFCDINEGKGKELEAELSP